LAFVVVVVVATVLIFALFVIVIGIFVGVLYRSIT